jgi:hypothetical protein
MIWLKNCSVSFYQSLTPTSTYSLEKYHPDRQVCGLLSVQFRQVCGLLSVQFRQVCGLLSVQFRQVCGLLSVQFRQVYQGDTFLGCKLMLE